MQVELDAIKHSLLVVCNCVASKLMPEIDSLEVVHLIHHVDTHIFCFVFS